MNDLDELVTAFRSVHDRKPAAAEHTKSRLLRSAHRRAAQRPWLISAGLVGALVLTNATTWAWTSRVLAPPRSERPAAPEPAAVHPVPTVCANETARAPAPISAPVVRCPRPRIEPTRPIIERGVATESVASAETIQAPADAPLDRAASEQLASALAELDAVAPPDAIDTADREAFAAAHRRHFGGATPSDALEAWDGYLVRFPAGRFAPEARFNRAVCLLRLGRLQEGREALVPFARGEADGLRQREARRLLDAIERGHIRQRPSDSD